MEIEQFELERWFGKYEHEADIMLAESGIRSLPASRFDLDPGEMGYVIPTTGDPEFRAEVGERYDRSESEVVFTNGTQEANFLTFLSLLGSAGDHAVVVTPTYQALRSVPDAFGSVTPVELSPPDWRLDPDAVREAITDDTAVVVCVNPNNPTGRYHPESVIREVYDIAAAHDAYLLCDEVYRLLADDPLPPVASFGAHGISTASLTKAYGLAGARFGWIAGPQSVIDRAVGWKDYTTISPSLVGQHVARQAMGEQETDILRENRTLAADNRARVADWIAAHDLDWHEPVGVNAFVTVPEGFDSSRAFCRRVAEDASVVLAPGDCFGYDDYFRLGFGLEREELEAGLDRVSRVINDRS